MKYKNWGLLHYETDTVETFASTAGIRFRKAISSAFRSLARKTVKQKVVVEQFPELEPDKPYIFASTHSFVEDIILNIAYCDRHAYILIGTTDQLEHNPQMYAGAINGMIYVNKMNTASRKESVRKMVRVLQSGSSVILFPEGTWNNSENLLVQTLFAGPWLLANETGASVVPVAIFHEHDADTIFIRYGEPLALSGMEKTEALDLLRDHMATMMFEMMEAHTKPVRHQDLTGDYRLAFLEERRQEYMRAHWTEDVWDEELTIYKRRGVTHPADAHKFVDDVVLTSNNASIMAPILRRRAEDIKYDFPSYMHNNWNRKK